MTVAGIGEPQATPVAQPFVLGTGPDPTSVMGRRIGAYVLDGLLALLLALLVVLAAGGLSEQRGLSDCTSVTGAICVQGGDRVYLLDGAPALALFLVPLAYAVVMSVLVQGRTGATPGKAAFGIRTVDSDGRAPGVGRAFVRTLLLPVDLIGCVVPLVGPITALSSRGHRRVGDMAAHTFVVDRSATGRPIAMSAAVPPPGPTGAGAAPPPMPPPVASTPPPPAPSRAQPATEPQWDPARGTYVVWDPSRRQWLGYDQGVGLWREL